METTKVRTNYFRVNNKKAWDEFLTRLSVSNFESAHGLSDPDGNVAFYAYGDVLGLNTETISEEYITQLKQAILEEGQTAVENFLGVSVALYGEDQISILLDAKLKAISPDRIRDYMNYHCIGISDHVSMMAEMVKQIQSLIAPGEACIMMKTSDYEDEADRLVSTQASAMVITQDNVSTLNLQDLAIAKAAEMTGRPDYKLEGVFMTREEAIKNARRAAECEACHQVVYIDDEGGYTFSEDYPGNGVPPENVIGWVKVTAIDGKARTMFMER